MAKKSARRVVPLEQLDIDSDSWFKSMFDDPPLVCALITGASIEKAIMLLVRRFLLEDSNTADDLFKVTGMLGTSHRCAQLAYTLGLISREAVTNISIIENIRNIFAHSHISIDFTSKEIADECDALVYPKYRLRRTNPPMDWSAQSPRGKFIIVSGLLFNQLMFSARQIEPRKRCETDCWHREGYG